MEIRNTTELKNFYRETFFLKLLFTERKKFCTKIIRHFENSHCYPSELTPFKSKRALLSYFFWEGGSLREWQ